MFGSSGDTPLALSTLAALTKLLMGRAGGKKKEDICSASFPCSTDSKLQMGQIFAKDSLEGSSHSQAVGAVTEAKPVVKWY